MFILVSYQGKIDKELEEKLILIQEIFMKVYLIKIKKKDMED
jgi:hypothetical protein